MLLWLLITSLRNFNFGRPISKDLGLSLDYSQLLFAFSGPAPATRLIFYHILNLDCSVTNAGPYVCLIFSSVWKKFDFPYVQHSNLSVCGLFFSSDGLSETKTPQLHAAPAAEGLRPLTSVFGGTQTLAQEICRTETSGFQACLSWAGRGERDPGALSEITLVLLTVIYILSLPLQEL